MPRPLTALAAALVLAACGTPQERCVASATRDLRVVDRLIGEVERDIARGYAVEHVQITDTRWMPCDRYVYYPASDDNRGRPQYRPSPRMCLGDYTRTVSRPRAIDIAAEQRKLDGMRIKRAELAQTAQSGIAACRAEHPE